MKALLTLLHSRIGAAIQWLVGLFIGWLSSQLIAAGIDIPAEAMHQLEMGLSALGAFAVTFAVQWYQARQAQQLQTILDAKKIDGWIGTETLDSALVMKALADQNILKP